MSFIKAMRKDDAQVQCSRAALSIHMRITCGTGPVSDVVVRV